MTTKSLVDVGAITPAEIENVRKPATQASTLPPRLYTDPAVWDLEIERIFMKEWLCVGRTDQLPNPGDYRTIDLLGEALVVVRGQDEQIRVLSRICAHRWMPVVEEGSGNRKSFQCPYHLWTYGLDGRLVGAPEMDRAEGFDKAKCRLPDLRTEIWQGFIFCNFDPDATPLGPQLTGLDRLVANYRLPEMRVIEPLVYDSPWNWKLQVDADAEGYHHLGLHGANGTNVEAAYPAALLEIPDSIGPYCVFRHPTADGEPAASVFPVQEGLSAHERARPWFAVVYPYHKFFSLPGAMGWKHVIPESSGRFTLHFYLGFLPEAFEDPEFEAKSQAFRAAIDAIHQEDIIGSSGMQLGVHARLARPARFSHLERSVWQWQNWYLDKMT